ncbi:3-hydroxyacyl-ACP dehydratase FabZ family protein [Caldimonas brevitalea]|uniref:3-hydroxyacyl-[acyl-carrier-protein] dehydratase n=1 Tax=Caldimonas brevitalea TaxID=413882 RepID=A0A0G3BQ26_9BURK|nr:hypothetical protein [Caldimonas brevitalea]AKJ30088.1 3-hydroxyacyl-[acyl-carrier-protein] dehydratase [Caldimonas brevitalea]
MSLIDIPAVLPHRHPMLLVDEVLHLVEGQELTARKAIALDRPGYYVDLPENAGLAGCAYPPALLLESWCQAAGILATAHQPSPDVRVGRVMLVTSVSHVRACGDVLPGDVIEHRVRVLRAFDEAMTFEGETVTGDGRRVLEVERVVMTMRPAASLRRVEQHQETFDDE